MIEVRGLTKRYGETLAVDGLTFDVKPGIVTGFLRPNGAGKSTTMRLMLGLDAPAAGRVASTAAPTAICPGPCRRSARCWTPRRSRAAAAPTTTSYG